MYVEVQGGRICRQLWAFDSGLYWATAEACSDEEYGFADQPEWDGGEGAMDLRPMTADEFEHLWRSAGGPPESA
jgi:hypothetical protein